jgi:dTDP-glucose 4,6-dehydratase
MKVVGLYRDEAKKNRVFAPLLGRSDVELIQHGVCEGTVACAQHVDFIIHCAGIPGGAKMHLKDPVKLFDVGINGTREMLDFAVSHNSRGFLFASSYEVYGEVSQPEPFDETHACQLDTFTLRNIYAEVKRLCESLCCAYAAKYGLSTYAVRLTSTFGSGVDYNDPRFFAEFARNILENKDIVLKSTGGTVRSYLDADDAAIAMLYVLVNGQSGNAYNLTNMENAISIRDIAMKMIEVACSSVKLKFDLADDPTKLGFRKEGCTLMDATKLENLGWKPVYSLDDTLEKLLASMKKSGEFLH